MDGPAVVHRIVFDRIGDGRGMGVLRSSFGDRDAEDAWHERLKHHYGLFRPPAATSYLEFAAGAVVLHRFVSANTGRNPSVALVGPPEHLAARAPYVRFDHEELVGEVGPLTLDELDRRSPVDGWDEFAVPHHEHALPVLAALLDGLGAPVSVVGTPPDAVTSVVHLVRRVLRPVLGEALPLTFSAAERDDDGRSRPGLPALVFLSEWPSDTEVVEHRRIRATDPPGARAGLAHLLLDTHDEDRRRGPDAYAARVEEVAAGAAGPAERVARLDALLRPRPDARPGTAPASAGGGSPALAPRDAPDPHPARTPRPEDLDDDRVEDDNERTTVLTPLDGAGAVSAAPARTPEPPRPGPPPPVRRRPPAPAPAGTGRAPSGRAPIGSTPSGSTPSGRTPPGSARPAPRRERPWQTYRRRRALKADPPRLLQRLIEDWADSPSHDDELERLLAERYGPTGRWLHAHGNVETLALLVDRAPARLRARARRFAHRAGAGRRFDAATGAAAFARESAREFSRKPAREPVQESARESPAPAGRRASVVRAVRERAVRVRGWWYRNIAAATGSAVGAVLVFVAGILVGRGA